MQAAETAINAGALPTGTSLTVGSGAVLIWSAVIYYRFGFARGTRYFGSAALGCEAFGPLVGQSKLRPFFSSSRRRCRIPGT